MPYCVKTAQSFAGETKFTKWHMSNKEALKIVLGVLRGVRRNALRIVEDLILQPFVAPPSKMHYKSSKHFLLFIQRKYWTPATERQAVTSYNFHEGVQ